MLAPEAGAATPRAAGFSGLTTGGRQQLVHHAHGRVGGRAAARVDLKRAKRGDERVEPLAVGALSSCTRLRRANGGPLTDGLHLLGALAGGQANGEIAEFPRAPLDHGQQPNR